MFAKEVRSDGGIYKGVRRGPTLALVEQAIDALDGKSCTAVTIAGAAAEPWLCVGGGNDGRYVVVFQQDPMNHWVVEDRRIAAGTTRVAIVCGFKQATFP